MPYYPRRRGAKRTPRTYPPRPYRRKYKKRGNKKNYSSLSYSPNAIVADKFVTKLNFGWKQEYNSISANASFGADFRGNGPRDPVVALGGTSCNGFARLSGLYNRYRCYGSKITVTLMSTSNRPIECVILCDPTLGTISSPIPYEVKELPNTNFWFSQNETNVASKTRSMYMSTAKATSETKQAISTSSIYQASVTADPADQWYWRVLFKNSDTTITTTAIMYVKIVYYVEFFERNQNTVV